MATSRFLPVAVAGTLCLLTLSACIPSSPSPSATPSITIDGPAAATTIVSPVEVSGTANTFEAALTVDAIDADGNTLCLRNIMATSGSGTPGTWETTLGIVPFENDEPVTVRAYELSAADGSIVNLVERDVTLSATHPAILITSPGCGATASPGSDLAVSGSAFVFEAQFTLELRDATGVAVLSENVTAASGTEESDWSSTLHLPASLEFGSYDLVAFDHSAKDGSVENTFSIPVVVE